MTARAVNKRQYEERDRGAGVPGKLLAAVALFGVAILLLYICFASVIWDAAWVRSKT